MPTTPSFKTRYMFSVQAKLDSYRLGETPAGFRVDIDYKSGIVKTDLVAYIESWRKELEALKALRTPARGDQAEGPTYPALQVDFGTLTTAEKVAATGFGAWLEGCRRATGRSGRPESIDWFGLEGTLISGSDWLLVRTDGVAEMDGRVTLQEETWGKDSEQGGGLINTQLATVIDLFSAQASNYGKTTGRPLGSKLYEDWKASRSASPLRFALGIRFAAAEASQPWAAAEYRSLGGFWRFETLPLFEYTANATASQADGLIETIELDVWRTSFTNKTLDIWGAPEK